MGDRRREYIVLVGRPEGKRPVGIPGYRRENNIKMDLKEMGCRDMAQNRDNLLKTGTKLQGP